MELKTDVIENQLNGISLGDGSKLQVGDANGQVVASTVNSEAGTKATLSFMQGQTEPAKTLETRDNEGNEILAVYNTLETTGWKLVGTVPVEMLVKDAKGILVLTMGMAVGAIVVAILIGFWMARMIATPLSKLKDLMLEGAKGNLNVRTQHKSKDEIGQLGQAFNLMVDQITKLVQQTNTTAQLVLETAGELTDASKKTAISAKEIAIATEEIANGASSLATEAERGNEMTEHMAKQMGLVITANEEMGSAARHVEQSSQYGTKQLNELLDKTHQTEEMTRELMHKVDALKQTASSVNKVLVVLQNITKQTNILSLNATIEAARAGAAGRGFMVVADEIRQLADQSRQSIDMVGQITGQIMSEMNETVEALSDAYPLFQHQMNAVKETNEIFVSVQEQMGDFTQRLQSVTESISALHDSHSVLSEGMSNVSAVAEESSATSEEVASLSNEQQSVGDHLVELSAKLENVSIQLKESLSRFTLN
ncbi:methyl-accepting chemotaxis protein [Paenibacillus sp. AR247]|uniref:methyl-accepting chemotaxis protein n=1 Tax=Paenibacillus sp. AR247 TaxID=1631599 RepID=UPI0021574402|nr:methyl-accepting chemotaxis protein [Paenibacillus sp. AR247]